MLNFYIFYVKDNLQNILLTKPHRKGDGYIYV